MDNISLHKDNVSININKSGSIDHLDIADIYSLDHKKIPIYFFIFEEYSKINPGCHEFNIDSYITVIKNTDESLHFTKTFKHPHNNIEITIEYQVHICKNIFNLYMDILTNTKDNYRYGVVIPLYSDDIHLYNTNQPYCPLVNFHRLWDRKWPDQTYVDVPIISINEEQNNYSIFCPIDYNSQYFFYKQDNIDCVRVSTSTHYSKSLNVVMAYHETSAKEFYVHHFPYSDNYINFWKTSINKIHSVHKVHITYDKHSKTGDKFTFQPASFDQIHEIIEILNEELEKYNFSLHDVGLSEIVLCRNLYKNKQKIHGCALRVSTILLDTDSLSLYSTTLHHEIFHILQHKILLSDHISKWKKSSSVPDIISSNIPEEEMANIYSYMMCDPAFIENTTNINHDIKEKILIIENIFKESTGMYLMWKRKTLDYFKHYHDADISTMNPRSIGVKQKYLPQICDTDPIEVLHSNLILLCGMRNSGLRLMSQYLTQIGGRIITTIEDAKQSCDDFMIYIKYLQTEEDFKKIRDKLNCKIIWMICNPQHIIETDAESDFLRWININSAILESNNILMVKYETLIVDDVGVIKEICNFTGQKIKNIVSLIEYDKIKTIIEGEYTSLFVKYYGFPILERSRYTA